MNFRKTTVAVGVGMLMLGGAGAAWLAAEDQKHPLPADVGDLSSASEVEIRDAAGQAVLKGRLETDTDDNRELEKLAKLTPASGGSGQGEAEVEVKRAAAGGAVRQEVEVKVQKLAAGATFTIHVDGRLVGSLTTDAQGEAEVELVSAVAR
jgi:hypothetical protein